MDLTSILQWGVSVIVFPLLAMVYRSTVSASERQLEAFKAIVTQAREADNARISRLESQLSEAMERLHQHQLSTANTYVKHDDMRMLMEELRKLEGKLDRMVSNMSDMSKYFTEKLHAPRS
jgi:hypothetical protein